MYILTEMTRSKRKRRSRKRKKYQRGGGQYPSYKICADDADQCVMKDLLLNRVRDKALWTACHTPGGSKDDALNTTFLELRKINQERRKFEERIWRENISKIKNIFENIKNKGANAQAGTNILLTVVQMFTTDLLFLIKLEGGVWLSAKKKPFASLDKSFFQCMIDKFNSKACGTKKPGSGLFLTGLTDYKGYFNALEHVKCPPNVRVGDNNYVRVYNLFRAYTKQYCQNIRQTCTILDFMVKVFEKQKSRIIGFIFSNFIDRFDKCVRARIFIGESNDKYTTINRYNLGTMCNTTDPGDTGSFGTPPPRRETNDRTRLNLAIRKSGIPVKVNWLDNCTPVSKNNQMVEKYGNTELNRIKEMCTPGQGWRRRFKSGIDTFAFGASDKNYNKETKKKYFTPKSLGVFAAGISGHSVELSLLFKLFSNFRDKQNTDLVVFLICLIWMIDFYHHSLREIYAATTMVWPDIQTKSTEGKVIWRDALELFKKNSQKTSREQAIIYGEILNKLQIAVRTWIDTNIKGKEGGATSIRLWAAPDDLTAVNIKLSVDKKSVKNLIGKGRGAKVFVSNIYNNLSGRPFKLRVTDLPNYDFLLESEEMKEACLMSGTPNNGADFEEKYNRWVKTHAGRLRGSISGGRKRTKRRCKTHRKRKTRRKRRRR